MGDKHNLFSSVLNSADPGFQEESPQWLLWEQQKIQASKCDSRGMRWHPLIIRWCLSIFLTSPAAYSRICKTNVLHLPHVNTLKKYTQFTSPESGFNPDTIQRLIAESKLEGIEDGQRYVSLVYDEMKIKSGLVYCRGSGKLVGFNAMWDINEEVRKFSNNLDTSELEDYNRELATYVIVYMVRGICSKLIYPFGYFA